MKRLFASILICIVAQTQMHANNDTVNKLTVKEMKTDFRFLYRKINNIHPDLFAQITPEDFEQEKNIALAKINKPLSQLEFFKVIAPFITSINDGHTGIFPFGIPEFEFYKKSGGKFLPLKVNRENQKLIISKTYNNELTKGCKILSINSIQAEKILDSLSYFAPGDSKEGKIQFAITSFRYYLWVVFGFGDEFEIKVTKDNRVYESKISGLNTDELKAMSNKDTTTAPNYTFEEVNLTKSKIGYLDINSFDEIEHFKLFFEEKISYLNQENIDDLIIDLRHNMGGDGNMVTTIYNALADTSFYNELGGFSKITISTCKEGREFIRDALPIYLDFLPLAYKYFTQNETFTYKTAEHKPLCKEKYSGNVYVLIDKMSFSASIALANLIKYYDRGMVIGEETEGRAKFVTSPTYIELPNSKLGVEISLMKLEAPVKNNDPTRGVIPDFHVKNTNIDASADDAVFNFTIDLIKNKDLEKAVK